MEEVMGWDRSVFNIQLYNTGQTKQIYRVLVFQVEDGEKST